MSSRRRGLRHTAARLVVRVAALRAPGAERDRMVREWTAELDREFEVGGGWQALAAAWGAFADAGAIRDVGRPRGEEGMMEGTMSDRLGRMPADLRLAARSLARAPGFTLVAVLTLALGIGGSAAIFTILDRVVLDPLPYPAADRLVRLENLVPGVGEDAVWSLSTAQWVHLTENAQSLAEVGLYRSSGGNVSTADGTQRARLALVTASMMSMLGAEAELGRVIGPEDDDPTAPTTIVVSHGFWTRFLGADPAVVGRSLLFNGDPFEVIGVMAHDPVIPGWSPSMGPDLWMPLRIDRQGSFGNNHVFPSIGLLAEGGSVEALAAELEVLTSELPTAFPDVYSRGFFDQYGFRTVARPLREDVLGDLSAKIWVLFAGVGLVLLIACMNVVNLFLVRVETKRRELAIRTALGASRRAIGRHLLTESLTLATLGGALALAVGSWAVPTLTALAPEEVPRLPGVAMGVEAVAFTVALALAVGLLIAAFPILGRSTTGAELSAGRIGTVGRERQTVRSVIVVSQMALALTLIVGAGLLGQTLQTLARADAGVEPEGVLTVELFMNPHTQATDQQLWSVYVELLDDVRALPGVVSAGMGEAIPVVGGFGCTVQGFEDEAVYDRVRQAGMTTCAGQERVTPGYFEALGVPLLEGRYLDEGDHADPGRAAVVVSRAFAERFWPGENPIGKGIGPSGRTVAPFYRVVGLVDDVVRRSDDGQPPLSQPAIAVYYPVVYDPGAPRWGGWWAGNMTLVVRTTAEEPTTLFPAVRRAIADVDPTIPLANARSMSAVIDGEMAEIAFVSELMAIAALVALVLAAVGLYGVVAYVVSRRTREIGTRLAIGARPASVVGGVVARTLLLAGAGIVLGVPLALAATNLARGLLVGVEVGSPPAYAAAAIVLAVVAVVASYVPARRAARVDPVTALRSD